MAASSEGCPSGLKQVWTGGTEIIVIDHKTIREPGMKDLLDLAYRELYTGTFPMEKGGEPFDKWLEHLSNPKSNYDYRIIVAGSHLRNCQKPIVKGICVGTYYKSTDTGILSYIVVDPAYRQEGLGKTLTALQSRTLLSAARESGKRLRGWFLECNNPKKVSDEEDGYGALRRLEKYQSWGGRVVPVSYKVPEQSGSKRKTEKLLLIAFPHPETGIYAGRKVVIDFLRSTYRDFSIKPAADHDFSKMKRKIISSAWRRSAGSGPVLLGKEEATPVVQTAAPCP